MTMTDIVPLTGLAEVKNPTLNLFKVPLTMGINPIDFQINPQEDYVDLLRSYFKIKKRLKKIDANNVVAAENTFLVNNLAHSLFKQISV